jgi:hypothetical protein
LVRLDGLQPARKRRRKYCRVILVVKADKHGDATTKQGVTKLINLDLPPIEPSGELMTVSVNLTPACSASLDNCAGVPLKEESTHHISTYLNPSSPAFLARSSNGSFNKAISRHSPIFM